LLLGQLELQVAAVGHVQEADLWLVFKELGGHENLPLVVVHSEDAESEA